MSHAPAAGPGAGRLESLGIEPAWSRRVPVVLGDGETVTIHALVADPPAGVEPSPTLVCVHGNPTWSFLWRSFLQRFGDRYRVVAIDQVSMGYSERAAPRRYAQRIDDLGRIMDAFGVEGDVVLVAHDWGGPIALGWAVTHRTRVKAVVLANTGIALPGSGVPLPIRLAGSRLLRDTGCRRTSAFIRGMLVTARRDIPGAVRAGYLAPYRSSDERRAIADFVEDIPTTPSHPSYAALAAVQAQLPELDVPVLLAWGERDPVFHPEFAADLAERLPQAELHRFPRAGHLVVEEEDVAAVADAWLAGLGDDAARATRVGASDQVPPLWAALLEREEDAALAVASGGGATLSFTGLAQRVAGLARGMEHAGVQAGDRVALLAPAPLDFIAAAFACWAVGAVTVVVDRGLGPVGIARALRGAGPRYLLGTGKTLRAAAALRFAPSAVRLDVTSLGEGEAPLSEVVGRRIFDADEVAAVVFTSGATGPAKGVVYTARQMVAQFEAVRGCYGIGPDDRLVAAFAPFALYGPALGIPVAVPDCDITKPGSLRAVALADACAAVDATIVFAAPAALEGVLGSRATLTPAGRTALGALRLVLTAGAPVPRRTLRAFRELAPGAELHTPYGMTELLSVADIDLVGIEAAGSGKGVCVGRPLAGVEVRIEPLDGGDGTTGEIVAAAPWLSTGYDGLWATTAHARSVDDGGAEWHHTGDVGHLDGDGRLWVEGRLAHVVWTADGPVTPVPLEIAVDDAVGARSGVAAVGPPGAQQVVVVVERDGRTGLAPATLDRAVREAVAPQAVAAVLTVPRLPVDRRHNSKIERARLGAHAERVLAGGRRRRRL